MNGSGTTERARIDRARTALRRGDPHAARVALMEHERRFVRGTLTEARDRLAIEALIHSGRFAPTPHARDRGGRPH